MSQKALYEYLFAGDLLFSLPHEKITVPENVDPLKEESNDRETAIPAVSSPFTQLKSRFLIVVNSYGQGLQPNEREFLKKVLNAVNYDLDRVDLFEVDELVSEDIWVVFSHHLVDYFLLLGVKPENLRLNIPLEVYQPYKQDGVWVLLANSLKRMELDVPKKRELWAALKQMFGV